jgi:predicted enzyme related to lactoylglutathione lyase
MKVESLDFVYMPSHDPAAELDYFERVLGWQVAFAIEAFDTRVAMLRPAPSPPAVLLAGHLHDQRPVLLFRVDSLEAAVAQLEAAGGKAGPEFGIPHGEVREIELPGEQRIAIYELTRPERAASIEGRRDF